VKVFSQRFSGTICEICSGKVLELAGSIGSAGGLVGFQGQFAKSSAVKSLNSQVVSVVLVAW